jgi:hypothetical protein
MQAEHELSGTRESLPDPFAPSCFWRLSRCFESALKELAAATCENGKMEGERSD